MEEEIATNRESKLKQEEKKKNSTFEEIYWTFKKEKS